MKPSPFNSIVTLFSFAVIGLLAGVAYTTTYFIYSHDKNLALILFMLITFLAGFAVWIVSANIELRRHEISVRDQYKAVRERFMPSFYLDDAACNYVIEFERAAGMAFMKTGEVESVREFVDMSNRNLDNFSGRFQRDFQKLTELHNRIVIRHQNLALEGKA